MSLSHSENAVAMETLAWLRGQYRLNVNVGCHGKDTFGLIVFGVFLVVAHAST